MKIDVVMPTYNSNKPFFKVVLRRLKNEVPIGNLIIIDKFSVDETPKVIKEVFPNAIIIRSHANLAYARYIGIKLVETEWFLFHDDDAVLIPGAFKRITKLLKLGKAGAIELGTFGLSNIGKIALPHVDQEKPYQLMFKKHIDEVTISEVIKQGLIYLTRGFTFATFIRTNIVKDWVPNPNLGALEDYSLTQWVISKGYKWILVDEPLVLHIGVYTKSHLESLSVWLKKGLWHGSNVRYVEMPRSLALIHSIARIMASIRNLVIKDSPVEKLQSINYLIWHTTFTISMTVPKYHEISR